MYRNTRFGELLKGFSRGGFDRLVSSREADKYNKGFSSWGQLVVMMYAQLSGCRSLREVEASFNNQRVHHYHLGCGEVKRSTLSDANAKRDAGVFFEACRSLMRGANRKLRREVNDFLYLLDSSSITLKGQGYDVWSRENRTRHTQGVKLHLLFNSGTLTPDYVNVSAANVNDVTDAANIEIESGSTYVFDKGYCDYNWWHKLDRKGAKFVTRFKKNAALAIVEEQSAPDGDILCDQVVRFKHKRPRARHINHYEAPLRQIVIKRESQAAPLVLATNDFERSAQEIAQCYKERWGIELFFKWIKQNLQIKRYLGRTENAVRIQIATALMSYLLVVLYRHTHRLNSSLKEVLVVLASSLFQRLDTDRHVIVRRRERLDAMLRLQGCLF